MWFSQALSPRSNSVSVSIIHTGMHTHMHWKHMRILVVYCIMNRHIILISSTLKKHYRCIWFCRWKICKYLLKWSSFGQWPANIWWGLNIGLQTLTLFSSVSWVTLHASERQIKKITRNLSTFQQQELSNAACRNLLGNLQQPHIFQRNALWQFLLL